MIKQATGNMTITKAILILIGIVSIMAISILPASDTGFGGLGLEAHVPLTLAAFFAGVVGIAIGYKWDDMLATIADVIKNTSSAIIILMVIGSVIGTWIMAGVVPAMVYYGLDIASPNIFLPATVILSGITSLACGSSWTTAGTIGVALLGIGQTIGVPVPMIAGAVISGGYFGDKLSPLSDTTNIAPLSAGSELFEHVKHMLYTTIPAITIALIVFTILGLGIDSSGADLEAIKSLKVVISDQFTITPWLFLLPILTFVLIFMKVPAIPALFISSLSAVLLAIVVQGQDISTALTGLQYGYSPAETIAGIEVAGIDPSAATVMTNSVQMFVDLFGRGGFDGMMYTVALILCALTLGAILEATEVLTVLVAKILSKVKSSAGLIITTLATCFFINFTMSEQYLSIVLPGRMYRDAYPTMNLHPKNLSRALEDSGTVTSVLVPWNTCGATMMGIFGVTSISEWVTHYVPYMVFNYSSVLISALSAITGITIAKISDEEAKKYLAK